MQLRGSKCSSQSVCNLVGGARESHSLSSSPGSATFQLFVFLHLQKRDNVIFLPDNFFWGEGIKCDRQVRGLNGPRWSLS